MLPRLRKRLLRAPRCRQADDLPLCGRGGDFPRRPAAPARAAPRLAAPAGPAPCSSADGATIPSACVPIEPVLPKITSFFIQGSVGISVDQLEIGRANF